MCCQETKTLNLPPEVIGALAHYRRLLDERGWEWGDERLPDFFRWARFSLLGPLFEAVADTGDWAKAVRTVIGDDVRPGIVVVYVDEGRRLHADLGEARAAIPDHTVPVDVVIDSAVAAGERLDIRARVRGPGAETLTLVGPDGIVAEGDAASELRYEAVVDGPTWVAAVAYGGSTPTRSTSRYPPTPRRYTSMLPESAFGASPTPGGVSLSSTRSNGSWTNMDTSIPRPATPTSEISFRSSTRRAPSIVGWQGRRMANREHREGG
jgi:hypothetical protein